MESGNEAHALAVLNPVLLGAVSHVTLAGLGEMFDCAPEPGAILSAIEDERYAYRSPLWGGTSTYANAPATALWCCRLYLRLTVRPWSVRLKNGSSSPSWPWRRPPQRGCCAVALDFYPVGKMGDVLPPLYTAANGVVAPDDPVYAAATHA